MTLNKDLDPATVISGSFDLREAGPDGVFGTADDVIYSLGVDPYTSGLTVGIPILNGPLGNGHYRFTAKATLLDRSGNPLGGNNNYVQFFTVALPSGFVFEGRSNDTQGTATSLSVNPQATADGSFTVLASQSVGGTSSCYGVATGDFNGDGKADLVTANYGSNNVSVLLGNGDGTFQSAVNYAVSYPYSVAVGDFNGDGKLDLVTANYYGSNTVSVLLGNGDGTFQSAVNYAVGSAPSSVAVGDFNGDGKLDLAVANYGGNNVSVLLGNGNGTFQSAVNYAVGTQPQRVVAGDVNGDGKLDLAVTNYGSNNVSVLLGNGNGTFGSAVNYAVGTNPQSVALGDINGDGKLDLAVANYGSNNVSVLLGNGNGTFGAAANYVVNYGPCYVMLADVNGDGRADVVVANSGSNGNYTVSYVNVLLSNGNGSLQSAMSYWMGAQAVAAADFNGDGRVDLAAVNSNNNTMTVLLADNTKPLTEDPVGSGLWMGRGIGSIQTTSDVDYWSFTALAGDVVSVSVDQYQNSGLWPSVSLSNAVGNGLGGDSQGGPNHGAFLSHYTIPVSGTYYLELGGSGNYNGYNYSTTGAYQMHVELVRGIQQESDRAYANDTISGANALSLAHGSPGHLVATVGGTVMSPEYYYGLNTDEDLYLLGTLIAGNVVELNTTLPSTSSLVPKVTVVNSSGVAITDQDGNVNDGHFLGTIPTDGAYYAKIESSYWAYNGHQYVVSDSTMTWAAAEAYAQSLGGHLVTINDQAEQDWLTNSFSAFGNVWTGFTDQATEGTWVWSSGQTAGYTNWASGEPSSTDSTYDYAYMDSSGQWHAYPSSVGFRAMVELNGGSGTKGPGPFAQYLLNVDVADLVPPQVTVVSPLPGNNNSTSGVVDRLTLSLNKDLDPATVISSSFDLREAGPDGVFDTADDVVYSLGVNSYTSGLSVVVPILNGPLGNGHYRFTAKTTLLDRSGNPLGGNNNYVQFFTVALPSGFVFEGRSNDTQGTATSLSVNPQATADGSFTVLASQSVGGTSSCYGVATGDFNGDGKADLVTANYGSNNVSVLLGNGDGTFQSAVNYAVSYPYSVAVGDFNGDGKLDLVTANYYGSNTVSVLLGNGDGTFQIAVNYAVGSAPSSVAVGDFNGDGKLDLAVTNYGSNNVSVLLGNGNGTFGTAVNYAVGTQPQRVVAGDVNGDGKLDLVTANYGSNNVSVLLGNGNGTFGTAVNYAVGTNPQSVALGDINGDGKLDLAVANYGSNNVSVLLGNGNGTFGAAANYVVNYGPCYVMLADVNGDGRADVVVANSGSNGNYTVSYVNVLLSNGDGSLQSAMSYWMWYAQAVAAGDFNGDGRVDLAAVNSNNNTVTVLLADNTKPLTEDPVGSGLWMGRGIGSIQTTSDVDYWSFTALAGDVVSVNVDSYQNSSLWPSAYLYNALGNYLASNSQGGPNYGAFLSHYTIPTSGTYYLELGGNGNYNGWYNYETTGAYQMHVELARGIQQESDASDANDTISGANALSLSHGAAGHLVATVAGTNMSATDKDVYGLGTLSAGNVVTLNVQLPSSSSWNGMVTVVDGSGTPVADTDGNLMDGHFLGTIPAAGAYYAEVLPVVPSGAGTGGAGPGPWAQYLLGVDVADLVPPQVTAVSPLPGNNNSTNGVVDRLTLTLSKDLDPTTVISSSFDLREAGPDGVFDTADDVIYSLGVNSYTSGLSVVVPILDGPLGNGHYRFTAKTTLLDRSGNQLGGGIAYVQFFTVGLPSGFVFEGRSNDTQGTATSLSTSPQATGDGSFTVLGSQSAGSRPYGVAAGDFNGDGKADLVLANYSSDNISVLLGNGDGTFQSAVNYGVGSSPFSVAVGDFNGDGKLDLVTANYWSNNVSVLLGNGDGTFQSAVNYAVGSAPSSVAVGNFNGDGKLDLAVANSGSNNVSVLLGNGDGTFQSAVNYAVGTNPYSVALGDINGDDKLDLAVANSGSNNVSVLLGNGDGTFQSAVNYAVGTNPYSVALGDINGDGKLDLAVANSGNNNVSVLLGNGNGTFGTAASYALSNYYSPGSNPYPASYQVILTDVNGDGRADVVAVSDYYVPCYYYYAYVSVLLGNSDGTLQSAAVYNVYNGGVCLHAVTAADFNGDGRVDLAAVNADNNTVTVLLADNTKPLTEDPVGSGLWMGRGIGSIQTTSDVDYWSFTALAGDVVSVNVDSYQNSSLWPSAYLYNALGNYLASNSQGGPNYGAFLSHYTIPTSGTYYLELGGNGNYNGWYNYETTGAYQMHVELARGFSRRATRATPTTPSAGPMPSA